MPNARPGLFGGLANLARRGIGNFMALDPELRMRMGAGLMQGGLPGLAGQYLEGRSALRERDLAEEERQARAAERLFQTRERQRQADTQAAQQMARQAYAASLSEPDRLAFNAGVTPTAPTRQFQELDDGRILNIFTGEITGTARPMASARGGASRGDRITDVGTNY